MNGPLRATWKFWKRNRSMPKRRVKLGIDYGVSTSKIVFRDCDPSGGESCEIVLHNGCLQIPSRVCLTATALLFGHATIPAMTCDSYESLKTQVAGDVTANPVYQLDRTTKLSGGFCAADLAALTVWFLISKGHEAVAAQFKEQMGGIELGMTMGVPTQFLNNQDLKATFLGIARRAWLFYCNEGVLDSEVSIEQARRVLDKYPLMMSTLPEEEAREWIRSEGDAALWMVLHSPSVGIGPYAKVDIGAGSTHTNLFRIFGKLHTIRRCLAPFGAGAVPVGMDAVDRAIAECEGLAGDYLTLRGAESSLLQANEKVRDAVRLVCNQIYDSYREAWNEAYTKLGSNPLELIAWRQHKVVILGGGSLVPFLGDTIRMHPDERELLPAVTLEQPDDLVRPDRRNLTSEELKLASVAYGLSNKEFYVPNPYCRDSV
jgi:hypothetical protein